MSSLDLRILKGAILWAVNVAVGVGKFQMGATLNARWMELCSSVCLCMYVIVSLLFCLCLCEVGQRRGQCGRGEIPKAAALRPGGRWWWASRAQGRVMGFGSTSACSRTTEQCVKSTAR